ncbi:hypothetical protein JCM5296_003373, partial [Sporobolomyces johnsonii]
PSTLPSLTWDASDDLGAAGFAERARLNALRASDAVIAARVASVHQENKHRRDDSGVFAVGGKAYISTSGMRLPKGVASKFVPRFIGPYTITDARPSSSTYAFDLPPHLRLHHRFHASKLRPHFPNDDTRFPSRSLSTPPPVVPASDAAEAEYLIEKVVDDRTRYGKKQYRVRYLGYSAAEDQWRDAAEVTQTARESVDAFLATK